jgi:polyhydroxybutyrate depolymerase
MMERSGAKRHAAAKNAAAKTRETPPMTIRAPRLLLLAAGLILGCACASAQAIPSPESGTNTMSTPGWHEHSLTHGGAARWLRVYVPRDLPAGAPTVLLLHGGTQSMRKIFRRGAGGTQAWPALAEREKFLLLVPNGTSPETGDTASDRQSWNDIRPRTTPHLAHVDDVGFLCAALDWAAGLYATDPARVYVTGASNGGIMAFRLLMEAPGRFAAAAAFVANLPEDPARMTTPARPAPLMICNGTLDPLMLWEGGEIRGGRGRMRSTPATVQWWVQANRADMARAVSDVLADLDPTDGCRIVRTRYSAQPGGAPVELLTVQGGGHALPSIKHPLPQTGLIRRWIGPASADAEGAELAWDFFKEHDRARRTK